MHTFIPAFVIAVFAALASPAYAQLSKESCIDAHSRGQDARDQGKISFARKLFLTCAQASCPAAVQSDCAKFADDMSNLQPTIVFVARDGDGNDLPETAVYVDGALVLTTLDGKPHDIDPGNHVVKFENGGKAQVVTVVIGSGEKGRTLAGHFGSPAPAPTQRITALAVDKSPPRTVAARTVHPGGALPIAITGALVAVAGAGTYLYGRSRTPDVCDFGSRQCAAPPGDPVFQDAQAAARTANLGLIAGSVGAAAAIGGIVWYVAGEKTLKESRTQQALAPWVRGDGGGISVLGRF
jgi:hypothetical protein